MDSQFSSMADAFVEFYSFLLAIRLYIFNTNKTSIDFTQAQTFLFCGDLASTAPDETNIDFFK